MAGYAGKKEDDVDSEVFPAPDDDQAAPCSSEGSGRQLDLATRFSFDPSRWCWRAGLNLNFHVQCRFNLGFMKQLNVTKVFGSDFCKVASFVDWVFASRGNTDAVGGMHPLRTESRVLWWHSSGECLQWLGGGRDGDCRVE